MDSYVDMFQAAGGSMIMLAKGNRSKQVFDPLSTVIKAFSNVNNNISMYHYGDHQITIITLVMW